MESSACGSEDMSGLLIDVAKHLCNLKYRIWENMVDDIDYSELTFVTASHRKRKNVNSVLSLRF